MHDDDRSPSRSHEGFFVSFPPTGGLLEEETLFEPFSMEIEGTKTVDFCQSLPNLLGVPSTLGAAVFSEKEVGSAQSYVSNGFRWRT